MSTKRPPTPLPIEPRKPVRNVPEVIVEEPTPIGLHPMEMLERRAKQTKQNVDETLSTVSMMRSELRMAIARDESEHKRLHAGLSAIGSRTDELQSDMREMRSELNELAMSSARVDGKLDILVDNVRSSQRIIEHHQKVTIETDAAEKKIVLEEAADQRRFRRQKWLKIIGILGGLATALAAGISALMGKC